MKTDKQRIDELERRVDELERQQPFISYLPRYLPEPSRTVNIDFRMPTLFTTTAGAQEWHWSKPIVDDGGVRHIY